MLPTAAQFGLDQWTNMTDKHCFLDLWQYTPTSPPSGLYWCHWTLSLQAWCIAEWTTVTLCFQPATFNAAVGSQYIRTTCRWIVTTWSCYCSVMRPSLSARHSARGVQTAHAAHTEMRHPTWSTSASHLLPLACEPGSGLPTQRLLRFPVRCHLLEIVLAL